MAADLCALPIADLSRLLRARKISPLELTDAYLGRIATFQQQLDAFITVTDDLARKQARRAEREIRAGAAYLADFLQRPLLDHTRRSGAAKT